MFVKSIILDGFKSYAQHTIIGPFDECFNAITGLNGTGKSNILDAMCFVLGVSSLTTVRATRLEDLISKAKLRCGESINSAKVAIVFDNCDKSHGSCPIGFESKDEIIVSRTIEYKRDSKKLEIISKYHLNGNLSQKNVIVDLFESVRLDVNNPNFMIMQGRITKVVSMKPKELLQMIEDTVGATIYQHKRDKTVNALETFKRQLNVLVSIWEDTIKPSYELQKKASRDVEEYNSLATNVKNKEDSYAVANFLNVRYKYKQVTQEKNKLDKDEAADTEGILNQKSIIQELKSTQEQLKLESNTKINLQAVEKEMSQLVKKFAVEEAKLNSVRLNMTEAEEKLQKALTEFKEELRKIDEFKETQKSLIEDFEKCNATISYAQKKVDEATEKEGKIGFGTIIDDDGKTVNLQERITSVEQSLRDLKGPNDILKNELKHELKVIREKEETLRNTPSDEQIERDHRNAGAEVNRLAAILRQNNIDPNQLADLENSLHQAKLRLHEVDREEHNCYNHNQYLRFLYRAPYTNFDPKKIHGQVYELFKVKDLEKYGIALEVAAGGYFTQVVVDCPETSKVLINNGNLQWRTTFLPLSALKSHEYRSLKQNTLDAKVGKSKAIRAIDLVEYSQEYYPLMLTVFGSTVICCDMSVAKEVAYKIGYRAVTLEGDVVDPGGTMQGGTRKNAGSLLKSCQTLRSLKLERPQLQRTVESLKQQKDACRRNDVLIKQHDSALRCLKTCADLLALTDYATLKEELVNLKRKYGERQATTVSVDAEIASKMNDLKTLRSKQKMETELVQKSKKAIALELKRWKRELELATKQKLSKESHHREIEIELKAKDAVLADFQKDIDDAKLNYDECAAALKQKEHEFGTISHEHTLKMNNHKAAIKASEEFDRKIEKIGEDVNKADQRIHQLELSKMKRSTKIKQVLDKVNGLSVYLEEFVASYPHIPFHDDMEPLSRKSADELKKELDHLKNKSESMRSRLNYRAAEALPKTEESIKEYESMKMAMNQNQNYLLEVVNKLDRHKMNLVENAHVRINKEFDFMMNTLLPNSHAKLVPVNPKNIAEGVMIHVCLGGVWKESLTELSGGQRSLVALALVLSLCMFNPAPFYILDEIDSALDLNHTANIGYLIRMYNNANVIFTTYFEDGSSKVKVKVKSSKARDVASLSSSR